MSEAVFTLLNIVVARFKPRDDISASAKRGHAARTRTLHSAESGLQHLLLCRKQTFLGISADGISLVSVFNQGPVSVISFNELFSISNPLLDVLVAEH